LQEQEQDQDLEQDQDPGLIETESEPSGQIIVPEKRQDSSTHQRVEVPGSNGFHKYNKKPEKAKIPESELIRKTGKDTNISSPSEKKANNSYIAIGASIAGILLGTEAFFYKYELGHHKNMQDRQLLNRIGLTIFESFDDLALAKAYLRKKMR